jgi:hypothetical protein
MVLLVTLNSGDKFLCPYYKAINADGERAIIDRVVRILNEKRFIELPHFEPNKSHIIATTEVRHIEVTRQHIKVDQIGYEHVNN